MMKRWLTRTLTVLAVVLAACTPDPRAATDREIAAETYARLSPRHLESLLKNAANWDGVCTSRRVLIDRIVEQRIAQSIADPDGLAAADSARGSGVSPYIGVLDDLSAAAQLGCVAAAVCYEREYTADGVAKFDVVLNYVMADEWGADVEADLARVRALPPSKELASSISAYWRYFAIQAALERDQPDRTSPLVPNCPD